MTGLPVPAPDPLPAQSDTAATVYSDYVQALEAQETARKSSLESRGVNVITTSGTLVTLLFGLVAVLTGSESFSLPASAHAYLIVTVILFVSATALGIIITEACAFGRQRRSGAGQCAAGHRPLPVTGMGEPL
jgi:hypothetical protein